MNYIKNVFSLVGATGIMYHGGKRMLLPHMSVVDIVCVDRNTKTGDTKISKETYYNYPPLSTYSALQKAEKHMPGVGYERDEALILGRTRDGELNKQIKY